MRYLIILIILIILVSCQKQEIKQVVSTEPIQYGLVNQGKIAVYINENYLYQYQGLGYLNVYAGNSHKQLEVGTPLKRDCSLDPFKVIIYVGYTGNVSDPIKITVTDRWGNVLRQDDISTQYCSVWEMGPIE